METPLKGLFYEQCVVRRVRRLGPFSIYSVYTICTAWITRVVTAGPESVEIPAVLGVGNEPVAQVAAYPPARRAHPGMGVRCGDRGTLLRSSLRGVLQ